MYEAQIYWRVFAILFLTQNSSEFDVLIYVYPSHIWIDYVRISLMFYSYMPVIYVDLTEFFLNLATRRLLPAELLSLSVCNLHADRITKCELWMAIES